MTEKEWFACTDSEPMLEFLCGRASDRKLRLFAVACCRRIWELIPDADSRSLVTAAERFAEGLISQQEFANVLTEAEDQVIADQTYLNWMENVTAHIREQPVKEAAPPALSAVWQILWQDKNEHAVELVAWWANRAATIAQLPVSAFSEAFRQAPNWERKMKVLEAADPSTKTLTAAECRHQVSLIHEIIGNPFHPVSVSPSWLNPTVINLAKTTYDQRALPSGELDPARLTVLADALQESGCDNQDILGHLRSPGPHVQGCWPVDAILGKC